MSDKSFNIGRKIKDCKKGTVFYSPAYGDVIFEEYIEYPGMKMTPMIICYSKAGNEKRFFCDGTLSTNGEVMLFPSRDERTWDNYVVRVDCPKTFNEFKELTNYYSYTDDKYVTVLETFHTLLKIRDYLNEHSKKTYFGVNTTDNEAVCAKYCVTIIYGDRNVAVPHLEVSEHCYGIFEFYDKEYAEEFMKNFEAQLLCVASELLKHL